MCSIPYEIPATKHFQQCIILTVIGFSLYLFALVAFTLVALSSLTFIYFSAHFIANKYCQMAMIDRA